MTKYNDIRNIRVLAFLDAYERQECLWNPLLDSYKNKVDRDKAYMKIIKELNIPTLTVHDVKLKVKGIRTTYTKELRLLTRNREQGKPYKPKLFWFNKANAFLKNVCVSRHKKRLLLKEEDSLNVDDFKDCTFDYVSDGGSAEDTTEHEVNQEDTNNILEDTSGISQSVTPIDFKSFVHVVNQTDIPTEHLPEKTNSTDQEHLSITESFQGSKTRNETPSTQNDDEFETFCRSVAVQLRSIPDSYSRSVAKLKIQQILFEAETGHYKNSPCITIPIV